MLLFEGRCSPDSASSCYPEPADTSLITHSEPHWLPQLAHENIKRTIKQTLISAFLFLCLPTVFTQQHLSSTEGVFHDNTWCHNVKRTGEWV